MADNSVNKESNGEIDLIDIFNRIGKGLGKGFLTFGNCILACVAFAFHNALILFISIVLGFVASYIFRQTEKPLYKSEITFRNNSVENADMINYFNQLSDIIAKRNTNEISSKLSIPLNEASDLTGLSAYWVIDINSDNVPDYVDYKDKHNPADTINVRMSDRFVVEVTSLDPMNLGNIREGLIKYAQKNPLAETANSQRIKRLNELIFRANIDIAELDSLQKVKYFEETRSRISEAGQIVLLQEQEVQMFYKEIQNLYYQKQAMESELALYPEVISVISDFLPSTTRINSTLHYSKITVPVSFFLAIFLLLLFKNRKKIVEVLNRY